MAGATPTATDNPLLRGLFGVLQSGAAAHADTATIWSDLRSAVGSWQFQAQGLPQPYDPDALQAAGRAILSAQGIDAAAVSSMRGLAGQWLGARENLASRGEGEQIMATDIFTPPWATTASDAVPSRFRIRTQWQIESSAGDVFTRWKADELTGPLTNLGDALAAAEPDADTTSGQQILSGLGPPTLLGYEIEQI